MSCKLQLGDWLKSSPTPLTLADIEATVDEELQHPRYRDAVDRRKLISDLQELYTVWTNEPGAISGDDNHQPWLAARRGLINWRYWGRYELYLQNDQKLAPAAVANIDRVSEEVLSRLEDPERDGPWDRRGLVMGSVQSGKTGTYTGLICKAADAGYKVIVVLAGLHNNLRSQTQIRLDEGFLGYKAVDPKSAKTGFTPTGVAVYGKFSDLAGSVTNRNEKGDFSKKVANQFGIHPGGTPILFVVKKNVSVLKNLLEWIWHTGDTPAPDDQSKDKRIHSKTPLLIVDDEADHGSVDTKAGAWDDDGNPDPDHDPTATNRLIRSLLFAFKKSAYVGFTATPFANIFIHEQARTTLYGPDLFPRSFIISIPAPSNYTGAAKIFGIEEDETIGLKAVHGAGIFRAVDDHYEPDEDNQDGEADETHSAKGWMPPRLVAKTAHIPLYCGNREVPPSLREAILCFLISTAVRSLRENEPLFSSMLVHVVRFTDVQKHVEEQVKLALKSIEQRLRLGDGDMQPSLHDEMKFLWDHDYIPTAGSGMFETSLPPWDDVWERVRSVASATTVSVVNGTAQDALNYELHRETGLNVIAIGGDKLSRGLTLEGLTVSYFLRSSRMYDTLMQMGRWFGYRSAYLDVCRLYSTNELHRWFRHIAAATEELRMEFDHMVAIGATPREYGLKVRSHPALLVTSAAKMRSGTKLSLSYAGDISETIMFNTGGERVRNLRATTDLIASLGEPAEGKRAGGYLWQGVSADVVTSYLKAYKSHPEARRADTELLSRYIRAQREQGELGSWSILLASSSSADACDVSRHFCGLGVGTIVRAQMDDAPKGRYTIKRLVNPSDELRDLNADERNVALERTIELWMESTRKDKSVEPPTDPSGRGIRAARPKGRAALLIYPLRGTEAKLRADETVIGIAISFPESDTAKEIEYTVTNVFKETGDYGDL